MSEDIKPTEAKPVEKPAEKTEEKTVGDIINETVPDNEPKKPEAEMVPLATFLETKKDAKKFEKLFNDLQTKVNSGDTSKEEINEDLDSLAEEFDIEPKFVKKLATILDARANKKAGDIIKPILERDEKFTKKERDEAITKAFQTHFAKAMETMPEYNEIANADVIKSLSLLPENKNKTFPQLIEETYGKAITGKRTIPDTKPGGGKDPDPIDFDKAKHDTKYFEEIMADPARKAEYNSHLLQSSRRRS